MAISEAPILWPPDAKIQLIWKDPDAEKDWRQQEKGTMEDKMIGWHHRLNGHESEQASGDGGQGNVHELNMTEQLDWTEISLFTEVFSWKNGGDTR